MFSKHFVPLSIEKFHSVRSDQDTLNLIQTKYRTKYLEMPAGGCFCNKVCERHSFYLLVYALLLGSIWKWVGHYVNTSINHLHQIRVNFTGEPNAHLLCHCLDCRKIGGASYSNNIVVPEDAFKLEGINAQFFQPHPRLHLSHIQQNSNHIYRQAQGDLQASRQRQEDHFSLLP